MSISASRFLSAVKANRALLLALALAVAASPVHAQSTGFSSLSDVTPFSGTYTTGKSNTPITATVFTMQASTLTTSFNGPAKFSGWVGIGTATPQDSLDVEYGSTGDLVRFVNSAHPENPMIFGGSHSGSQYIKAYENNFEIYNSFSGGTLQLGAGNTPALVTIGSSTVDNLSLSTVGIGTATPIRELHMYSPAISSEFVMELGNAAPDQRKWNLVVDVPYHAAGGASEFYIRQLTDDGTTGNIPFVISSSGNVGIGTLTPEYKLDVGGRARATSFSQSSDMRLKTNIHPIEDAIDKIMALHGVTFNWKQDGRADMGVVAQDVEKVFPAIVSHGADGKGMMAVEYNALIGPTIEAIRQLKTENDAMKAELASIKATLKAVQDKQASVHDAAADAQDRVVHHSSSVEP